MHLLQENKNMTIEKKKMKFLFKLLLKEDLAGYIRKKDMVIYEYGILAVKTQNREIRCWNTSEMKGEIKKWIFYDEPGEQNIIEFEDNWINENWNQMYAFFFDADGVFVMYADRSLMDQVGIKYDIASSVRKNVTDEIRQEALLVARFMGIEVSEQVRTLLDDESKHMSHASLLP